MRDYYVVGKRGWLVAALLLSLVLPVGSAEAREKVRYRLLIMDSQQGEPYDSAREGLLAALVDYGYQPNLNLDVRHHSIGNDRQKGELLLRRELENDVYDVVFVNGTLMTIAAKEVAYGQPGPKFIFACVTDPVGMGVVEDFFSPPPANFTGVSYPVPVKSRLRFVRQLMPGVKTIGMIYADMPQSQSYRGWLEELLASDPEFADLKIIFRSVPLHTGEDGSRLMAEAAGELVRELDGLVDLFLSPNDQMGAHPFFAEMVYARSTKPLVGVILDDVMKGWGATASIYPSHEPMGRQAARMIHEIFQGRSLAELPAEWPQRFGVTVDLRKTREFGLRVPVEVLRAAGGNIVK